MPTRDDFNAQTKARLAKRVGFRCSRPGCRRLTSGPARSSEAAISIGVAAHITAAARGGPRFDSALSPDDRKAFNNGIWLCEVDAKLVDADEAQFTVDMLREWKSKAEQSAFDELVGGGATFPRIDASFVLDLQFVEGLVLSEPNIERLTSRMLDAARRDLESFKSGLRWPNHPIELTLRGATTWSGSITAQVCAIGLQASGELTIVAPPGTGKSTTAIQVADNILSDDNRIAVFIPLGEWSMQSGHLLESLTHRAAFRSFSEHDFVFAALHGRLSLMLDGWNELDAESRRRAIVELERLRRETPLVELVVTTRRQALDVPLFGPTLEIQPLSVDQQDEISRALAGSPGVRLLERARRTQGLRELLSIPLYLDVLLKDDSSGSLPTTKEGVLRKFVARHESSVANAEVLRSALYGLHSEFLRNLAVEATTSMNTAVAEQRARAVVSETALALKLAGQLSETPQPMTVLDVLVAHHTLVYSGERASVSFQHQQFQEWFASHEVEALIEASPGSAAARGRLRAAVLDAPAWEEAILFACDRLARSGEQGERLVAELIVETLGIDPMLSAEMIFRSTSAVWTRVATRVVNFVERWHERGSVDRAVRFMIATGREEFGGLVWPLIENTDNQVYLRTLRAARRFRPTVLGVDAADRLATLSDKAREDVVSEIAQYSELDGMELAAAVAKADESAKVKVEVIESLLFRRCQHLVREVLSEAPAEVWREIGRKGYANEISDPELSARLRTEASRNIEDERDDISRLALILEVPNDDPSTASKVEEIVRIGDLVQKDRDVSQLLKKAFERFPRQVGTALVDRIANERKLPYWIEPILRAISPVSDPRLKRLLFNETSERGALAASQIVSHEIVEELIRALLALRRATEGRQWSKEESVTGRRLAEHLAGTRIDQFIQAWLQVGNTTEPIEIGVLAEIFARHRRTEASGEVQPLDEVSRNRLKNKCIEWVDILLVAPAATRSQLAELASAIGHVGSDDLVQPLCALLDAELSRLNSAREEYSSARSRGERPDRTEASTRYSSMYQHAFQRIGSSSVSEAMPRYLTSLDFGSEAAWIMKTIHDSRQSAERPTKWFGMSPDFSGVAACRAQRARNPSETSVEAEAIFAVVSEFLSSDKSQAEQLHALNLARVGVRLPHGDKAALLERLLGMELESRNSCSFLTALVLGGEIIDADRVLDEVRKWLQGINEWQRYDRRWELQQWLSLLPFSDRPNVLLDAVDLASMTVGEIVDARLLHSALKLAPDNQNLAVLIELGRRWPALTTQHMWMTAILERGDSDAPEKLLDLFSDPSFGRPTKGTEDWWLSEWYAEYMRSQPQFRDTMLRHYRDPNSRSSHRLIESSLSKSPNAEFVLLLVQKYGSRGARIDYILRSSVEHLCIGRRPSPDWKGAFELFAVDSSDLRHRLFAMTASADEKAIVARECLTAIDEFRDEYGKPLTEPRHPDIAANRPWPSVAM